jgi:prepilin-type N-terminal cleavage/methylation domain-containing protein
MKKHPVTIRTRAGFSLAELILVLVIVAILGAVIVPMIGGETRRKQDKRHAQEIVLSYSTGLAARVPWPAGDVATVVAAVVSGRKPNGGAFVNRTFRAKVPKEELRRTYRYLGRRPDGELFFDPMGGQDPEGR